MAKEINTDPETDKSAEKEQISYKPSDGEMSYLDFFGFSVCPTCGCCACGCWGC